MPGKVQTKYDYHAARALYLQGNTLNAVAKQLNIHPGALQNHARRYKWNSQRVQREEHKQRLHQLSANFLADKFGSALLERHALDAERTLELLETSPKYQPKDLREAKIREELAQSNLRRIKEACGLDQPGSRSFSVNIAVLAGDQSPQREEKQADVVSETIDVDL